MSGYAKSFNETKHMPSSIKDGELSKKYNKIWNAVSNSIKEEFVRETVVVNNTAAWHTSY